jgi:mRNA-binding protein PUF3
MFDNSASISDLAVDQSASRLIQTKIESSTPQERDYIFDKLYNHILPLSIDVFGNYSVQKLLEFCNKEQQGMLTTVLG